MTSARNQPDEWLVPNNQTQDESDAQRGDSTDHIRSSSFLYLADREPIRRAARYSCVRRLVCSFQSRWPTALGAAAVGGADSLLASQM